MPPDVQFGALRKNRINPDVFFIDVLLDRLQTALAVLERHQKELIRHDGQSGEDYGAQDGDGKDAFACVHGAPRSNPGIAPGMKPPSAGTSRFGAVALRWRV